MGLPFVVNTTDRWLRSGLVDNFHDSGLCPDLGEINHKIAVRRGFLPTLDREQSDLLDNEARKLAPQFSSMTCLRTFSGLSRINNLRSNILPIEMHLPRQLHKPNQ